MSDFIAGAASAGSSDLTKRRDSALELKMKSTLLAQQHAQTMEENQQSATLASPDEDTSGTLRTAAGSTGNGPLSGPSAKALTDIVALKQQAALTPGGYTTQLDVNGLPWMNVSHNLIGRETSKVEVPGHAENLANYRKLNTFTNALARAHVLYQSLDAHNAWGLGKLVNMLPEDAARERAELSEINKDTGPLKAQVFEGLSGGRYSAMIGEKLSGAASDATHNAGVEADMYGNGMLNAYAQYNTMAPTTRMPDILMGSKETPGMFFNLPHDVNGKLIGKPTDYSVRGGSIYDNRSQQKVLDFNQPGPAVHPSVPSAIHNNAANQAVGGQKSISDKISEYKRIKAGGK